MSTSTTNNSQSISESEGNEEATHFLKSCWPSENLYHQIAIRDSNSGRFNNRVIGDVDEAINQAKVISDQGNDAYFAIAEFKTPDNRKSNNAAGACCFWMDIDCGKDKAESGKGYVTKEDARTDLDEFCVKIGIPSPSHIVDSGNGLHVYWVMDKRIEQEQWKQHAAQLKALTHHFGLKADDTRTADIASVLRIPGTANHKSTPKPVAFIKASCDLIESAHLLTAIGTAFSNLPDSKIPEKTVGQPQSALPMPSSNSPQLERLKAALSVLDPDCSESEWKLKRLAPLALLAKQFPGDAAEIKELAIAWSRGDFQDSPSKKWLSKGSSNGKTGEEEFVSQWARFSTEDQKNHKMTVGTIYYEAKEKGVSDINLTEMEIIQGKFCLIKISGKVWLLDKEEFQGKLKKTGKIGALELSSRQDGALLIARKLTSISNTADVDKVPKSFFNHPQTTLYSGIEFNPVTTTQGYLNLWVGPTLEAQKGKWDLIKAFLREVICNGDDTCYQYLIRYLAHAVQKPEEKPGVMVILLGGQGIGKGTFGRILSAIWSSTYIQVNNVKDITGSFNSILGQSFIVFMDEALFEGDRRSSDALKSLVTEPTININEKHQPARQTKSYHRFFAATNATHFKNTDNDDRRDFVLRVSETYKGNHEYWIKLNSEIETSGTAAMLHVLKEMDLSGFNVRDKPSTEALIDQKLMSLGPYARWWFDCLDRGYVIAGDRVDLHETPDGEWTEFISTETALNGIKELSGGRLYKNPIAKEVQSAISKYCPSAAQGQRKENGKRKRGVILPNLTIARNEFEKYIGGAVDWLDTDES